MTTIEKANAVQIVQALAEAKSRQDIAATMEIYHPDAVLESPSMGTRSVGAAVRDAISGWFAFAPDYRVELDGYGLDGETLCCWGTAAFTPAFTFTGAESNGAAVTVPVFILFGFADGRIDWEASTSTSLPPRARSVCRLRIWCVRHDRRRT